MKVGIWGYGFVGQSVDSIIDDELTDIIVYDNGKSKYKDNKTKMLGTDIVFICVPTPSHDYGEQDPVHVRGALKYLINHNYEGTVVVKSTVLYDNIMKYEDKLNLVFNPEFLNQNTFINDAYDQKMILIGGEQQTSKKLWSFYSEYCDFKYDPSYEFCTLKESCDFKYTRNLYGAYKVLFWEFIQETTGNARKMSELYHLLPYQSEMSQVGMDGFRGYGGACFPKDVSSWDFKHQHELTAFMKQYNKFLSNK